MRLSGDFTPRRRRAGAAATKEKDSAQEHRTQAMHAMKRADKPDPWKGTEPMTAIATASVRECNQPARFQTSDPALSATCAASGRVSFVPAAASDASAPGIVGVLSPA